MTKSYIKKVSFKLFLEEVQVRCRTQWRRKLIPSVRAGEREGSLPVLSHPLVKSSLSSSLLSSSVTPSLFHSGSKFTLSTNPSLPSGVLRRRYDGLKCAAWRPPRPVAQCRQFPEEAKDASVSECTWTVSALEALRNALYKFKTYLLTYLLPTLDFFYLLHWDWTGPITLIVLFSVSHFNFLFIPCGID